MTTPFSKGRLLRNKEITLTKSFKISRITISTKLGTKHPLVKGIQFCCSNEGTCPFPREDNYGIAENTLTEFKIIPLRNHWANFNLTLHKASLGKGDSIFFQ